MRLAQLARKIGTRSSDIVQYLSATTTTDIADDANTKLSDEQVAAVIQHFAPGFKFAEPVVEETAVKVEIAVETEEQVVPQVAVVDEEPISIVPTEEITAIVPAEIVQAAIQQPEAASPELEANGEIELIKAPKVALSGLKVLGKIELPQPKKKEVKTEGEEATVVTSDTIQQQPASTRPERKPRPERNQPRKNRYDDRPRKNPVALQREREAEEAEEKRKEDLKRAKEKRTQHYQQRVKPTQPVRAMRLYDEPTETEVKQSKPEPTSLLGKFWRWFRS